MFEDMARKYFGIRTHDGVIDASTELGKVKWPQQKFVVNTRPGSGFDDMVVRLYELPDFTIEHGPEGNDPGKPRLSARYRVVMDMGGAEGGCTDLNRVVFARVREEPEGEF